MREQTITKYVVKLMKYNMVQHFDTYRISIMSKTVAIERVYYLAYN